MGKVEKGGAPEREPGGIAVPPAATQDEESRRGAALFNLSREQLLERWDSLIARGDYRAADSIQWAIEDMGESAWFWDIQKQRDVSARQERMARRGARRARRAS